MLPHELGIGCSHTLPLCVRVGKLFCVLYKLRTRLHKPRIRIGFCVTICIRDHNSHRLPDEFSDIDRVADADGEHVADPKPHRGGLCV
jgi:hypothetical protein